MLFVQEVDKLKIEGDLRREVSPNLNVCLKLDFI